MKVKRETTAVNNVNTVLANWFHEAVSKKEWLSPHAFDNHMVTTLDGTSNEWGFNKSKLGANAILPVSMLYFQLLAHQRGLELYEWIQLYNNQNDQLKSFTLPIPCFNVVNGGSHAGSTMAFQEFMMVPHG